MGSVPSPASAARSKRGPGLKDTWGFVGTSVQVTRRRCVSPPARLTWVCAVRGSGLPPAARGRSAVSAVASAVAVGRPPPAPVSY